VTGIFAMAFINQPKFLHKFCKEKERENGRKVEDYGYGLQGGKEMVHKKKNACNK
jgi:hypothetical protein